MSEKGTCNVQSRSNVLQGHRDVPHVLLDPREAAGPDRGVALQALLMMQIFDVMICRVHRSTQESQRIVFRNKSRGHFTLMEHTEGLPSPSESPNPRYSSHSLRPMTLHVRLTSSACPDLYSLCSGLRGRTKSCFRMTSLTERCDPPCSSEGLQGSKTGLRAIVIGVFCVVRKSSTRISKTTCLRAYVIPDSRTVRWRPPTTVVFAVSLLVVLVVRRSSRKSESESASVRSSISPVPVRNPSSIRSSSLGQVYRVRLHYRLHERDPIKSSVPGCAHHARASCAVQHQTRRNTDQHTSPESTNSG
jgi:hypothetical protein